MSLLAKQLLDTALAAVGLVVLSPVLLLIALRIRLVDGSPVLFRQTRVGLHGREFTVYKFRTMVVDAEARLAALEHLNERSGIVFKIAADPRITADRALPAPSSSTSCRSCGTYSWAR